VVEEALSVVTSLLARGLEREDASERIRDLEHRGDDLRKKLVAMLGRALVTPIDREDIYRLSRSIDDTLDGLRDFVREWDIFHLKDPEALSHVVEAISQAARDMRRAVECIVDSPEESSPYVVAAVRAANRVRLVHEDEIALLFAGDLSMRVIRQRELLHRLDAIGLHLVRAGQILSDAFVKRGE